MTRFALGFFLSDFFEVRVAKRLKTAKTEDSLDERLLTAAVDVFLEKGFAAASIDEIAARAKASKLTFYNHYGNKEALFEAVMRRQNRTFIETLTVAIPDGMPLKESLEMTAHRLYEALLRSDAVKLVRVLHAEADRFPKLGNVFDEAVPARSMKLVGRGDGKAYGAWNSALSRSHFGSRALPSSLDRRTDATHFVRSASGT